MRIDDNLADALGSADAARGELARYLRRITSNRGLMVKVLVVIMVCVAAFVLFVA
jgi:syntaxin 5